MPEIEATEPLTEAQVDEIEARANAASRSYVVDWSKGEHALLQASGWRPANEEQPRTIATFDKEDGYLDLLFCAEARTDIPALIRDWRAMKAQVEKFSELADKRHDELCEARRQRDSLAADMATHIRDATAALREQLAAKERELEAEYERQAGADL